ncbi:MAG TPA: TonB family protein [Chryseolinea sp.]
MRIENAEIQSMNDLVFENRNKAYGAYAIRKAYSNNVHKGLLFVLVSFSGAMIMTLFFNGDPIVIEPKTGEGIVFVNIPVPKLKPQKPATSPPVRRAPRDIAPIVSTRPDLDETKPQQTETTTGAPDGPLDGAVPIESSGPVAADPVVATPVAVEPVKVFVHPEVMPQYEGGMEGLAKYMRKNLKYPAVARRMGTEGLVFVSFIIDIDGHISEAKVIKGISKECDEEAVRVVSKMPSWIAGRQGNAPVIVRMVLPIKFQLGN